MLLEGPEGAPVSAEDLRLAQTEAHRRIGNSAMLLIRWAYCQVGCGS